MTKPWEETWKNKIYRGELRLVDEHGMMTDNLAWFGDSDEKGEAFDIARARCQLASAAPDMARLLLELEWTGERQEEQCCPSCFAEVRRKEPHAPDCALATALRKAGVR